MADKTKKNLSKTMTGKTLPDKKKHISTLISAAVGLLVMVLIQQYVFKTSSYDKQLMQAANEINKSCPVMVDHETRLDNAIALPDNVFQYNYTLVNLEKKDINIPEIKNYLKPKILNTIKTNPDLKFFRDHKTTMSYSYNDKNGIYLFKLTFTADQYK